jgi:hypothetical protein
MRRAGVHGVARFTVPPLDGYPCPVACLRDRSTPDFPVQSFPKGNTVGSVIKKRRKRMAKKKHRKLLKRTRVQRRRLGK